MRRAALGSLLLTVASLSAREIPVLEPSAVAAVAKSARPGDTLVLASGEWADAAIIFEAHGTPEARITLRAAEPGKSVLTGRSMLRLAGDYLVVDGLHFRDPAAMKEDIIEFRRSTKALAHHSRLTNCAITSRNEKTVDPKSDHRWVGIYGADNEVDHCHFEGKATGGATAVVWLGEGNEGRHYLHENYFGPRPVLGRNGGETLRVGDSKQSMQSARCVVERNLFERCNGELECISNKSCDNIYRGNTFLAVGGTLTLRQGNRCLVEGNRFIGQGVKGTGGIRVIAEGHVVRKNQLDGLRGDHARAALCFMMGVPDSPLNAYFQVRGARLEDNVINDCSTPLVIGLADHPRAALAPIDTIFSKNVILAPDRKVIDARCDLAGVQWEDNRFHGESLGIAPQPGIIWEVSTVTLSEGLSRSAVGPSWAP